MTVSNLRPQPFEPGNRAAVRHGFYAKHLTDEDASEIADYEAELAALTPARGPGVGPLVELASLQRWRLLRGYRDLSKNGVTRGTKAAAITGHLAYLERSYIETLKALALTPLSAVSLGLELTRSREANLENLTDEERAELGRLLQKTGALGG
jgi:hypothetical protein